MKTISTISLSFFCAILSQASSPSFGRDLAIEWRWSVDETNQRFQPGPLVFINQRLFCCVAQFNKDNESKWTMEFHLWEFNSAGERIHDILLHLSEQTLASPLPSRVSCFASSKIGQLYAIVRPDSSRPLLIKINEALEVVYKKPLFSEDTTVSTIQFLANDNFVLTGRQRKLGILAELNPAGEIIRTKEFPKEGMSCLCSDFRTSADDNFLLTVCSNLKNSSVSIHKLNDRWNILKSQEITIAPDMFAFELFEFQFSNVSSSRLGLFSPSRENGNRIHTVKTYDPNMEALTEINVDISHKSSEFSRSKSFDNDTVAIASKDESGVIMYLLHNDGQEETHLKITDRCPDVHTWIESSEGHLWLVTRTCGEDEAVGRVSVFAIEVKK